MLCILSVAKITRKTVLDRGRTDRISLTHHLDFDLQSHAWSLVMTYSHATVQDQRLVGSELDWKQTDEQTGGRTEAIALPPLLMPMRSVKNALKKACIRRITLIAQSSEMALFGRPQHFLLEF